MTRAIFSTPNILIYLADDPPDHLLARAEQNETLLVTSALCVAEVLVGARSDYERSAIAALLTAIETLPFDKAAAEAFRLVPFKRNRLDRFIAAQAMSRGLTIVTNNVADFADVPSLQVENWLKTP